MRDDYALRVRLRRSIVDASNALRDESGAGLAEYGLLLLSILVLSVTILGTLGATIADMITQVHTNF